MQMYCPVLESSAIIAEKHVSATRSSEKEGGLTSNARPSVGIEVCINLVEEVERRRVALLNRKD